MREDSTESITATELARNVSQTIDNVRINRKSILITRGKKVIAKLSPPPQKGLSINGLIGLMGSLPALEDEDIVQMSNDMKMARDSAKLPESPWE